VKNRSLITAAYVLLQIVWSGYSALAFFGSSFVAHDDEGLELSVIWWRWLAVSLLLGLLFKSLRRGANVQ
jgi:hypothetical protein